MKRKMGIAITFVIFFAFTGCSDNWETQVRIAELESHVAQLEEQLEYYREKEAQRAGPAPVEDPPAVEEPEVDLAPLGPFQNGEMGSRKSPVPVGRPFTFDHDHIKGDMNVSIQITEVLRGEEAMAVVQAANSQNKDKVPAGKELLLMRTRFALNRFDSQEQFHCSSTSFLFYSGDNSQITSVVVIVNLEELNARLYEGGEAEGWMYTVVDPSDATPHAVFDNTAWFALYGGTQDSESPSAAASSEEEESRQSAGASQPEESGGSERDEGEADPSAQSGEPMPENGEGEEDVEPPLPEQGEPAGLFPDIGTDTGENIPT